MVLNVVRIDELPHFLHSVYHFGILDLLLFKHLFQHLVTILSFEVFWIEFLSFLFQLSLLLPPDHVVMQKFHEFPIMFIDLVDSEGLSFLFDLFQFGLISFHFLAQQLTKLFLLFFI